MHRMRKKFNNLKSLIVPSIWYELLYKPIGTSWYDNMIGSWQQSGLPPVATFTNMV